MTAPLAAAIVVIVIAGFLYEVRQAATGRPTISQQIWSFAKLWPPILFLVGVLAGHLFTASC